MAKTMDFHRFLDSFQQKTRCLQSELQLCVAIFIERQPINQLPFRTNEWLKTPKSSLLRGFIPYVGDGSPVTTFLFRPETWSTRKVLQKVSKLTFNFVTAKPPFFTLFRLFSTQICFIFGGKLLTSWLYAFCLIRSMGLCIARTNNKITYIERNETPYKTYINLR